MKNVICKKGLLILLFLGMMVCGYAQDRDPIIEIVHHEDKDYVEYTIQYYMSGPYRGKLTADVYADDQIFLKIRDGELLSYTTFPSSKGRIHEVSRKGEGFDKVLKVRWEYPLSYLKEGRTVTCKLSNAIWKLFPFSKEVKPNVTKSFTIEAGPYPKNFTATYLPSTDKLQFNWEHTIPTNPKNWKFYLFKREKKEGTKWNPIGSMTPRNNTSSSFSLKLTPADYDKTWEYAVVLDGANVTAAPNANSNDTKIIENKVIAPSINDLRYSYDLEKGKMELSWEYSNESKMPLKLKIFRQKTNPIGAWNSYPSETIDPYSSANGKIIVDFESIDLSKEWTFAVSLDIERKDDKFLEPYKEDKYTKKVFVSMIKPLPQDLTIDFNPSDYKLTMNWNYVSAKKSNWKYSFFRKEKEKGAWEMFPDTFAIEKEGNLKGTVSLQMDTADFGKEWLYAISLDSIATDTLSSVAGHVDSVSVSIYPPYPQDLSAQPDTTTHKLDIKWRYENPQKLNWKYAIYKRESVEDSWQFLTDTICVGVSVADTICVSFLPKKRDLRSNLTYAVSLFEDKAPEFPPQDSYYTQEVEVAAILPPIPYGKYLRWAGIGLVLLLIIAIFIMTRMGFRL